MHEVEGDIDQLVLLELDVQLQRKQQSRWGPSASTGGVVKGGATATRADATFAVTPLQSLDELPELTLLRIGDEVLSCAEPSGGAILASWPYHRILCWGYTATAFQWRAYASSEEELSAGGAADAARELESATPTAASVRGSAVVSYSVATTDGRAIEAALMGAVLGLMGDMSARGVGAEDFAALLTTLISLTADGFGDHALAAVKQMALGRAFDARQAAQLLGALSEFDRIEACVALFPGALLNPTALPTLLQDAFDDPQDIENVCHRLGITVGADGSVGDLPTAASRKHAARQG